MSLQLILGRSGTGKTTYCYENIKNVINNKEKIYIITPEQYSFTAEKNLLDSLGTNSVVNAEVLSFNRIAHKVFLETGGAKKTFLSKCGKNIIIFDILSKNKKKLKFLNNEEKNLDVALNAITELRRQNVQCKNGPLPEHEVLSSSRLRNTSYSSRYSMYTRNHTASQRPILEI